MSGDDDIPPLIPPKRRRLDMASLRCIFCLNTTTEKCRVARAADLERFRVAAEQLEDRFSRRLVDNLENTETIVWHSSCYSEFTSEMNESSACNVVHSGIFSPYVKSPIPACQTTLTRSSSGHAAKYNTSLCLFCQKGTKLGTRRLSQVLETESAQKIREKAQEKKDDVWIRIANVDLVAIGAKYHQTCRSSYISKFSQKKDKSPAAEDDYDDDNVWQDAFAHIVGIIDHSILQLGGVKEVGELRSQFNSVLQHRSPDSSCDNRTLKRMLQRHYGDRLGYVNQNDRTKSQLVFSVELEIGDAVNTVKQLTDSLNDSAMEQSFDDDEPDSDAAILMHAARILNQELQSVKGLDTWPPEAGDMTEEKVDDMLPTNLKRFLEWTLSGDPGSTEDETLKRRILAVGQDLVFITSKGRILTPKHVALANAMHQCAHSKTVLTMMNRFGHCISHDQLLRINTAVASQVEAAAGDVVIPSGIKSNTFTQIAADNNDILEETLDGKITTHCTNMIVVQRQTSAPCIPAGQFSPQSAQPPRRQRSASKMSPVQLKTLATHPKRINPKEMNFLLSTAQTHPEGYAVRMDAAWLLSRMVPQKLFSLDGSTCEEELQCVPAWTAFNSMALDLKIPVLSVIGYCPVIDASPTEYNAVYTLMDTACNITEKLGQQHTVLTLDQAIYCKALDILNQRPEEFSRLILRMGGFHIITAFLAVIGKRMEASGLEDILIESGVFAEGSVPAINSGKAYNRAVRAHKLLMEALNRIIIQTMDTSDIDKETVSLLVSEIRKDFASDVDHIPGSVKNLQEILSHFMRQRQAFLDEGSKQSPLFQYWNEYLSMVQILLNFLRAERTGDWDLHKSSLASMLPYFFAFDRQNYSRYATVYLADMEALPQVAPEVDEQFKNGEFVVARSTRKFAQVSVDLALEQTINKDTKTSGGIVGFSRKQGTVQRWMVTRHYTAALLSQAKTMAGITTATAAQHKECGVKRLTRDESDVLKLMDEVTQNINPFVPSETTTPLMNIKSGQVASPEVAKDLAQALEKGKVALGDFVDSRLNKGHGFYAPIKRQKLKTFASMKRTKKPQNTSATNDVCDRELFSRIIVIAQVRQFNLKELFTYELTNTPFAIANTDGCLRKTDKSVLLKFLESQTEPQTVLEKMARTCAVFDLMALVQSTASVALQCRTFGQYAELLLRLIVKRAGHAERIDVVCDRYDWKESIKQSERQRRSDNRDPLLIHIHGPDTKMPKQWNRFLAHDSNKEALADFLQTLWMKMAEELDQGQVLYTAGCTKEDGLKCFALYSSGISAPQMDLFCSHEEADTRMVFHAWHALQYTSDRVVIHSPDTDVLVICVALADKLPGSLFFSTGTGDKHRFLDIKDIHEKLGTPTAMGLIAMHALTGCDTTSSFYGIGKRTAAEILQQYPTALDGMGESFTPSSKVLEQAEHFIVRCYSRKDDTVSVNDYRYVEFLKTQKKSQSLPPCQSTLVLHIKRATYQAAIWSGSLESQHEVPSPTEHGWDSDVQPVLTNGVTAPKELLVLHTCACKMGCRGRCRCKKNGLVCTPACGCGPETCSHTNVIEDDSDNDE